MCWTSICSVFLSSCNNWLHSWFSVKYSSADFISDLTGILMISWVLNGSSTRWTTRFKSERVLKACCLNDRVSYEGKLTLFWGFHGAGASPPLHSLHDLPSSAGLNFDRWRMCSTGARTVNPVRVWFKPSWRGNLDQVVSLGKKWRWGASFTMLCLYFLYAAVELNNCVFYPEKKPFEAANSEPSGLASVCWPQRL